MKNPKVGEVWIVKSKIFCGTGGGELVYVREIYKTDNYLLCIVIDDLLHMDALNIYSMVPWQYEKNELIKRLPEAEWEGYNKEAK